MLSAERKAIVQRQSEEEKQEKERQELINSQNEEKKAQLVQTASLVSQFIAPNSIVVNKIKQIEAIYQAVKEKTEQVQEVNNFFTKAKLKELQDFMTVLQTSSLLSPSR